MAKTSASGPLSTISGRHPSGVDPDRPGANDQILALHLHGTDTAVAAPTS